MIRLTTFISSAVTNFASASEANAAIMDMEYLISILCVNGFLFFLRILLCQCWKGKDKALAENGQDGIAISIMYAY